MIITRHAVERYLQFHLFGDPLATEATARAALEAHAPNAVKCGYLTARGDQVWRIEALGIEIVVKRENGVDTVDTCVTVLPPPEFRGLTPAQVDAAAAAVKAAEARVSAAAEGTKRTPRVLPPISPTLPYFERKRLEEEQADAARWNHDQRLAYIKAAWKREVALAQVEKDVLCAVLKTMRTKISAGSDTRLVGALRVAKKFIRSVNTGQAFQAINQIDKLTLALQGSENDDVDDNE